MAFRRLFTLYVFTLMVDFENKIFPTTPSEIKINSEKGKFDLGKLSK